MAAVAAAGYEVHGVCHSGRAPKIEGVCWHRVDLLAPEGGNAVVESVRPSHLLHLAWYAVPQRFWSSEENVRWVEASLRLLRAFASGGGRRAVVAGSCAEYDVTHGPCSEVTTPRRPSSLYGVAKNALQEVLAVHSWKSGYSAGWARLFQVYGPGEARERLVPSATNSFRAERRF